MRAEIVFDLDQDTEGRLKVQKVKLNPWYAMIFLPEVEESRKFFEKYVDKVGFDPRYVIEVVPINLYGMYMDLLLRGVLETVWYANVTYQGEIGYLGVAYHD